MFIIAIILLMFMLNLLWWFRADARLRPLPWQRLWRTLLGLFMGGQILFLLWIVLARILWSAAGDYWPPRSITAAGYLWNLMLLPLVWITWILFDLGDITIRRIKKQFPSRSDPALPTRRRFLASAAAIAPPLLTGSATLASLNQLGTFRVRRLIIPLPQLPPALDGLTIAHVSDVHIGRFVDQAMLDQIVYTTNHLLPDLILFTGDLINLSLSELPPGIDMLRRFRAPGGVFLCEGNHDLIPGRSLFESAVKSAALPLLVNESHSLRLRGQSIQLLGLAWSHSPDSIHQNMTDLLAQRRSHEFPILLAHHPHAFDPAAAAEIPLTLSGHTHGGQLMLNERLGFGPAMFKYWTGLYQHAASALVVSNGTGNWFPLRIHAPAEILHLTLRRI